ncbi:Zinc finger BED domain-containing protein 4 [Frankliniella fusca]|uniref:Zinc finger BED domain-containing protein 4 n=1 Tax=Frankliniella fusca TaxID=407009 RepID=A0AAE1HYF4_9NEOP|nr:Zinc finger BED domain-containing protein 4 [Frankliniella fusca]
MHKTELKATIGACITLQATLGAYIRMQAKLTACMLLHAKLLAYIPLHALLLWICDDWNIKRERVRGVTTDGGANIKAAVKTLFCEDKHVTCLAHILNGIGQKVIGNHAGPPSELEPTAAQPSRADRGDDDDGDFGMEEEEREARGHPRRELIVKTKKIVRFFKQSEVASAELLELQVADGKPEFKCLKQIQEVRTRFNSCFDMCVRYLELAPYTAPVLHELQRSRASRATGPEALNADEEEVLTEMRDLLAPLARATKEISGEKICNLSKVIPVVQSLANNVNKYMASTPVCFDMKEHLLALLREKFANVEGVRWYAAATLLDPRFKKFGFNHDTTTASSYRIAGGLVKAKMAEAADAENAAVQARQPTASQNVQDDFWGDYDEQVQRHSATQSNQDMAGGIPVQLRQYLDRPPVDRLANPDPLIAWAPFKGEYKAVYSVAEEYLIILATAIPSERLFSNAGLIASPIKSRMSPKHLELLVF